MINLENLDPEVRDHLEEWYGLDWRTEEEAFKAQGDVMVYLAAFLNSGITWSRYKASVKHLVQEAFLPKNLAVFEQLGLPPSSWSARKKWLKELESLFEERLSCSPLLSLTPEELKLFPKGRALSSQEFAKYAFRYKYCIRYSTPEDVKHTAYIKVEKYLLEVERTITGIVVTELIEAEKNDHDPEENLNWFSSLQEQGLVSKAAWHFHDEAWAWLEKDCLWEEKNKL